MYACSSHSFTWWCTSTYIFHSRLTYTIITAIWILIYIQVYTYMYMYNTCTYVYTGNFYDLKIHKMAGLTKFYYDVASILSSLSKNNWCVHAYLIGIQVFLPLSTNQSTFLFIKPTVVFYQPIEINGTYSFFEIALLDYTVWRTWALFRAKLSTCNGSLLHCSWL